MRPIIDNLFRQRGWEKLPHLERVGAVYNFVKDGILFGYEKAFSSISAFIDKGENFEAFEMEC